MIDWLLAGRSGVTPVSYRARMEFLLRWLRTLGTSGAVANAHSLSEEREREEGLVDSLLARLSVRDREATAA